MVKEAWSTQVLGCPMFVFAKKLRILKKALRGGNESCFNDIHSNVSATMINLDEVQLHISNQGASKELVELETKA